MTTENEVRLASETMQVPRTPIGAAALAKADVLTKDWDMLNECAEDLKAPWRLWQVGASAAGGVLVASLFAGVAGLASQPDSAKTVGLLIPVYFIVAACALVVGGICVVAHHRERDSLDADVKRLKSQIHRMEQLWESATP
jgi:hypothetical protein